MEKVTAQKLPASWFYNTYSSDLMQNPQSFEELIPQDFPNHFWPEEPKNISSIYDGLLNQDRDQSTPENNLRRDLVKQYFSEANITQKNIKFSYYGFRHQKRDLVWGLTQILNSSLVELGLSNKLQETSVANAREYIRMSRQFEWSVPGDAKLEKYLRRKSDERSKYLSDQIEL